MIGYITRSKLAIYSPRHLRMITKHLTKVVQPVQQFSA